jgi:hypothetical protein
MKKNKILLLPLLFAALVLSGCGKKTQNEPALNSQNTETNGGQETAENVQNETAVNEPAGGEETIAGTLETLLRLGRAIKCTYESAPGKDKIIGDLYISGNKYYQEVTFPDNGKFYSIGDSEWIYTWNSRVPGGTKMKLEKKESENLGAGVETTAKEENYACIPWVVDQSKFTPPANIEFKDETAKMKALESSLQNQSGAPMDQCSICDSIPDASLKAKCKQESNCAE